MDGGAWRTTVHGAAKSRTRPTNTVDADLQSENGKCSLISSALPEPPPSIFCLLYGMCPPGEGRSSDWGMYQGGEAEHRWSKKETVLCIFPFLPLGLGLSSYKQNGIYKIN